MSARDAASQPLPSWAVMRGGPSNHTTMGGTTVSRLGMDVTHARTRGRVVSILIAFVLAIASLVALGQPAQADPPGISSALLLNGTTYDGTQVVNEGDTLTLRVSYNNAVEPGSTVVFDVVSDNVEVSDVPSGNSAIQSITQDGNKVTIVFKDPIPVHEGTFDLKFKVKDVEDSVKEPISWSIDGDPHSVDVIIRKSGDQFENVSDGATKNVTTNPGTNPTNLDGYVHVDGAGNVTLDEDILTKDLFYTLQYATTGAKSNVLITDSLQAGLGYVTTPNSFAATLTTWDANGLNQETNPFPSFDPTPSGNSFSDTVDLPANSILNITYRVRVTDKALLEGLLQDAYDAYVAENGTAPGTFQITRTNTANLGEYERTRDVRFRGTIAGINIGNAFNKSANWSTKIVKTGPDGKLTPPADVTYTLRANLGQWNGSGTNFPLLTDNVVITDALPSQASWNTGDADFVTLSGSSPDFTTLTRVPTCPADISTDAYVGQYCVNGQTLMVNVGKKAATNVNVQAKALVEDTTGLTKTGGATENDPATYTLPNTASFDYGAPQPYQRSVDVKVTVLPASEGGTQDTSVFSKASGSGAVAVDEGERAVIPYTFTVGADKGIDARTSKIVDYVDPTIFDLGDDFDLVEISGTYNRAAGASSGGVVLTAADFELSLDTNGNLVIELSESGKTKVTAQGADRRWVVNLRLQTKPLEAQQTLAITNDASLYGAEGDPLYWDEDEKEATSFGNEAEVRKRVYDRDANEGAGDWVETLKAAVKKDGTLVQKTYVYRVEYIPRGDWGVQPPVAAITPVLDKLPDGVTFKGFVSPSDAATGDNASPGPVDVGGNVQATYDSATKTVTLASTGALDPEDPVAAYIAVEINDPVQAAIVNKIDYTEATIDPQEPPSIDIEKWTVEGQDSGPVYDGLGNLTNDGYTGDFDAAPGKGLVAGKSQPIRFTVSNDGGEALKDVKVSDQLVGGAGTIQGLTCTFPDDSAGTQWAGPFEPAAKFECTGTLPALTAEQTHHDRAKVVGTGIVSGDEVDDEDNWHAHVTTKKTYAIGDYVWIDKNNDGKQGSKEKPLKGVKVELIKDGKVVGTTVTDKNGHYLFDNLPAGTYQVKFTLTKAQKKKYSFTKADAGSNDGRDSDANKSTGLTKTFVLNDSNKALTKSYPYRPIQASQGIDPTWDAGVIEKSSADASSPGSVPPATGLPATGNPIGWGVIAAALALLGAGGVLIGLSRRRRNI